MIVLHIPPFLRPMVGVSLADGWQTDHRKLPALQQPRRSESESDRLLASKYVKVSQHLSQRHKVLHRSKIVYIRPSGARAHSNFHIYVSADVGGLLTGQPGTNQGADEDGLLVRHVRAIDLNVGLMFVSRHFGNGLSGRTSLHLYRCRGSAPPGA